MEFNLNPKERFYFAVMAVISFVAYVFLGFYVFSNFTRSQFLITILLYVVAIKFFILCFLIGHIRGNAIKVTAQQFPDIYALLKEHAKQLDLKTVPAMYILQGGGLLNAFATRFVGRNLVVIYSDVLETAYQEGMDAVSFIIGHELGHVKRDHLGFAKLLFTFPARLIPFLSSAYSRACEYTCDNIGYALCPEGAAKGVLILAAGKRLYKNVDIDVWITSGEADRGFALWLSHIFSTHPPLVHRIAVINARNSDKLLSDHPGFVSPSVEKAKQAVQ